MIAAELLAGIKTIIPEELIEEGIYDPFLGNNGKIVVSPINEHDIASVLKFANENVKKVNVISGGTKKGYGGIEASADILLSMANYKGIIEHTVGDMTVTVKAGTGFKELQDYLDEYKQKIPLDPAWPTEATIGGVIAANDSGPKRLSYGSARDLVIGSRIVYPNGSIIRTGGKTVKNVAGYDMNKLFIGSMGTLGVISEVTLKLRPLHKFEGLILLSFPDGNLNEIRTFIVNLLDSVMEPVAFELLGPTLAEKLTGLPSYTLAISFEDVESSVRFQIGFVKDHQPQNTKLSILEQNDSKAFWSSLYKISPNGCLSTSGKETWAALKIGVKNLDVIWVIKETQLLQDIYNLNVVAHGGLGHGLCQINFTGTSEDVVSAIKHLRIFVENQGGYAIVKHLPLTLRRQIEVWGEKPAHFFLLEGIKTKVDPNRILNHKRFVGGI
ncbi:FAD-binding oxidoreductase [Neobacillus ginsengisoli]|uniref:Glycolate oxidase FAD binding subunit n=1 Tax=Neobacillus ginsengisoli TaxID=904295 RepID=A0ABT9XSH5_9BACI|nr:FAD-binding oxidoreductase [Neobacillus ginsengisoli]MDQ0197894.1 glycolate oxidase FAD binding subunit [Neobacillus ginsengisoli]